MQLNPFMLSILSLLPAVVSAGKAQKFKSNPKDVVALADFPFGFDKNMRGNIVFSARDGGKVDVHVDVTGLPSAGGPFRYHIHDKSIPGNGNCDLSGSKFNPFGAPDNCDNQKHDGYCQVGDLSGKHGWIDTTCFETKYSDPYLSLDKKSKSYIIDKSIVFHFANMTKFACADIELVNPARASALIQGGLIIDSDTISILLHKVEDGYSYDAEDYTDNQEADHNDDDDGDDEFISREYTSKSNNGTWDDEHDQSTSNKTVYRPQQLSSDCENGSSLKSVGFVSGLAGVLGLLL